jgi:hypothetical protein
MILRDASREHFREMDRLPAGEVFDLLPAGNTRHGDDRFGISGIDCREEPFFADGSRDVVVFGFISE